MKNLFAICPFLLCNSSLSAQSVFEKDFTKPAATEVFTPMPAFVTPGVNNGAPSDAIVLFDGKNLDSWVMSKDGKPCQWDLKNNVMVSKLKTGNIKTKQKFGDCQLHIEFMLPADVKERYSHSNAGNSGVYMQERYEIQIFDSYKNESATYANGLCGSVYKQSIPMVNANSKPGEWNTFDIYYTAPRFGYNGSVEKPAYITIVHNGVLISNHFEIQGSTKYIGMPRYELHSDGSIELQEHGSEVSFRNIWIRKL